MSDDPPRLPRAAWQSLSDAELLAQCAVDTYRASGPGGQKRNKTSSAVRIRHLPTALLVIAEESRSQHENKAKALLRLRAAFALHWRDLVPESAQVPGGLSAHSDLAAAFGSDGRLEAWPKRAGFWPAAGVVLDALLGAGGQLRTASEWLGVNSANLGEFLEGHPKLWQEANRLRLQCGLTALRPS